MKLHAFGDLTALNRREYVDRAGLEPVIASFGGATLQQRLANGAKAAAQILTRYVGSLSYSDVAAEEMFSKVDAWQTANRYQFEAIMRSGANTVPEQVKLAFGDEAARQFVVAAFSQAVKGLKAWDGGAIRDGIMTDQRMTQAIAEADAENRLIVFAQIVILERDGTLRKFFDPKAAAGMGELATGTAIVIGLAVVALIAGIVVMARSWMDLRYTDNWIRERCRINPEKCDRTLENAIDNMFEGKSPGGGSQEVLSQTASQVGKYLGIGLLAYVGFVFVLPAVRDAYREKDA